MAMMREIRGVVAPVGRRGSIWLPLVSGRHARHARIAHVNLENRELICSLFDETATLILLTVVPWRSRLQVQVDELKCIWMRSTKPVVLVGAMHDLPFSSANKPCAPDRFHLCLFFSMH